jgi:hypothetical protein
VQENRQMNGDWRTKCVRKSRGKKTSWKSVQDRRLQPAAIEGPVTTKMVRGDSLARRGRRLPTKFSRGPPHRTLSKSEPGRCAEGTAQVESARAAATFCSTRLRTEFPTETMQQIAFVVAGTAIGAGKSRDSWMMDKVRRHCVDKPPVEKSRT